MQGIFSQHVVKKVLNIFFIFFLISPEKPFSCGLSGILPGHPQEEGIQPYLAGTAGRNKGQYQKQGRNSQPAVSPYSPQQQQTPDRDI